MSKQAMTALWADCLRYTWPSRRDFLRTGLQTAQQACPSGSTAAWDRRTVLSTRRQFMGELMLPTR